MFRYYLDSNIYRLLKPTHPGHRADLRAMIAGIKSEVLIFYSDGHFDDLKETPVEFRDVDLQLIAEYANDNYFTVDLKFNLEYFLADPLTAFYEKDYAAAKQFLNTPQKLDSILPNDDNDALTGALKSLLNSFFSLPLRAFAPDAPEPDRLPAEHSNWLNRMIPNYSPNMSLSEFWDASFTYSTATMGDQQEMTALRKYASDYIDRETISWDNWKSQFNRQFKTTALGKSFTEMVENMLLDNQKSNLWLRIGYLYVLLETYGITQERVGKKVKKNSMSDLFKDAHHVYYASFTDYLVTEDKGMQLKAHIIYELLNFSTKVLNIKEFMAHKHLLQHKETMEGFIPALVHDLKYGFQLFTIPDLRNATQATSYKTTVPYFGYFNRFQVKDYEITLYCSRKAPRANFVMYKELQIITRRLLEALGQDDEQKGEYELKEKTAVTDLRTWTKEGERFSLSTYNQQGQSFILLIIVLESSGNNTE